MSILQNLTLAERARQLRDPEGPVGLAVAEALVEVNKHGNAQAVRLLGIQAGDRVLEIGFGNGRAAPDVLAQAAGVTYTGIDSSATMVAEAQRFNAAPVAAGQARFELGTAEALPFADGSFARVFSLGVAHFWADPLLVLRETHRVLAPGGALLMGMLAPQGAPEFALPAYGFYLREAATWGELCRAAGFTSVEAQSLALGPPGPNTRAVVQVIAHA